MKQELILALAFLFASCGGGNTDDEDEEETVESSVEIPVIQSADTARKNLLQEYLFDNDDYLNGFKKDQSCCEYSVQRVNGALRFEVRKDDETVSGSKRAEVSGRGYKNEERWYGLRVKLEDWVPDNAGEGIIQWHPVARTGSANAGIWASGGMYMLVVSPDGNQNNYYELDTIRPNIPVDFVLHIKWSPESDGLVEIWKDGKYIKNTVNGRLLPYKGVTTSNGCYMKLGINKFGWSYEPARSESTTTKRVMYYEEFREGNEMAGYEDVKPGGK